MANEIKILWDSTPAIMSTASLDNLAAGNIWQSGEVNDANPANQILRISYSLTFLNTPVSGDLLKFFIAQGDRASASEIWHGGIGITQSQITLAARIAEVHAALSPVHQHAWQTTHGMTFEGIFDVWFSGPSWQLLIEPVGEALDGNGNKVRYTYGTPQKQ